MPAWRWHRAMVIAEERHMMPVTMPVMPWWRRRSGMMVVIVVASTRAWLMSVRAMIVARP